MTQPVILAAIILCLPISAFIVQIFFGRFLPRQGDFVPTGAMGVAFLLALKLFFVDLLIGGGLEASSWEVEWMTMGTPGAEGSWFVTFGIAVDNLTVIMLLVVTGVSFLVHVYSTGYMQGEDRYNRFFAFLALFSFSMLGLILCNNLLFMFIFWELVGVCSYFLIGFYFQKDSAANASKKAFITNRVGDLGFFIALMIILKVVGSLAIADVFESVQAGVWTSGLLTAAGICLFFGPIGKSAQFPLHVWLPDAMEGPTPVSALIHAATMVAAGVYLVARMFPFFAGPGFWEGDFFHSVPLMVVALVGGFTALFAATIAVAQDDIKKVLAYSTISQLGFMVLAIGCGAWTAGLFHLFTHAFFKALLFLGSGSVIHAVHTNDMKEMGGLRKKMPITFVTFLIGTLAISGFPFLFSGFYSKEAVLTQALAFANYKGGFLAYLPFVFAALAAGITAFYMFRIVFMTFLGKPRNEEKHSHAHESPLTMSAPLMLLAVVSVVSGGFSFLMGSHKWFEDRTETIFEPYGYTAASLAEPEDPLRVASLAPVSFSGEHASSGSVAADFEHAHHAAHTPTMIISILIAFSGMGLSWMFFGSNGPFRNYQVKGILARYQKVLVNLYYVDHFYSKVFVGSIMALRIVCSMFDKYVVDGIVNFFGWLGKSLGRVVGVIDHQGVDGTVRGTGAIFLYWGKSLRQIQTGRLPDYLFASVVLLAVLFVGFLFFL